MTSHSDDRPTIPDFWAVWDSYWHQRPEERDYPAFAEMLAKSNIFIAISALRELAVNDKDCDKWRPPLGKFERCYWQLWKENKAQWANNQAPAWCGKCRSTGYCEVVAAGTDATGAKLQARESVPVPGLYHWVSLIPCLCTTGKRINENAGDGGRYTDETLRRLHEICAFNFGDADKTIHPMPEIVIDPDKLLIDVFTEVLENI